MTPRSSIDGAPVPVLTRSTPSSGGPTSDVGRALSAGNLPTALSRAFGGRLDELRISVAPLSAARFGLEFASFDDRMIAWGPAKAR